MEDYDSLPALWEEASLPYRPKGRDSRASMERELKLGRNMFLVAESRGKIVGVVLGTQDGRKGWINRLAVAKKWRRKGIAGRLVREAEKEFAALGINITAGLIEDWNGDSMKFFEKMGYVRHRDIFYYSKRKDSSV